MKRLLAFVCIFLLFSCNSGTKENTEITEKLEELKQYPSYRKVARHLLENYQKKPTGRFSYELAKKPEGWFIVISDWSNANFSNITEIKFWSKESKAFESLDANYFFKRNDKLSEEEFEYFMQQNSHREYYSDILPYSGYLNNYKDNIALLENYDKMNDTLYHALGIAYFGMTQYYLGYKSDFSYLYNDHYNPADFEKYIESAEKCIDTYKKGIELNPNFKCFIGKLPTKMSNDIVGIWYEMELRGQGDKTKYLLKNVNYPQSIIDFAINTLNSCDTNAILFTHGDNDTYPLWYVQEVMNVRADISVINLSLLGAPFYSSKWKGNHSIPITLSYKMIKSDLSSIVVFNTADEGAQNMNEIFDLMSDEKLGKKLEKKMVNTEDYLKFSSKWVMDLDNSNFKEHDLEKEMTFNFQKSYIYRTDLLMMNIIHTNQWKRPIYFAQGFATSTYSYLEPYLLHEGLVLSLNPYILYENHYKPCSDTLKWKENLLKKYTFSKLKDADVEERIVYGILNVYYQAVLEFKDKNPAIAIQLLDKAFKEFPGELLEGKFIQIQLAIFYKELGDEDKASKIISKLIQQLKVNKIDKVEIDRYHRLMELMMQNGFKNEAEELKSKL